MFIACPCMFVFFVTKTDDDPSKYTNIRYQPNINYDHFF